MPHTITENGEPYATLADYDEAQRYLEDIRKRDGYVKLDIRDAEEDEEVTGRWEGEDRVIWGSCACWDYNRNKMTQFYRKFLWPRDVTEITKKPLPGNIQWFNLELADEGEVNKALSKILKV